MNKQKKQTMILLIVLGAVVALFLLFKYVINFDEEETDTSIPLWSLSEDSVDYMSYTGTDGVIELTKTNGSWMLTGYEDEEVDTDQLSTSLGYLLELSASEEIGVVEDASQFGFDEPTNVITLKADGVTYKLIKGAYNSNISGYYIQINDDPTIYVWSVSSYLSFEQRTYDDYIVTEAVSENDVSEN